MVQVDSLSIEDYKIIRELGAGGMGEVYLAEDLKLERMVALKVLPVEASKDAQLMRRFVQEAKVASRLNHPNICVIHEVGKTVDGRPFIAMEYVEGNLLDFAFAEKQPDICEILHVAIQIADAIDEAHTKNIIHRDIKPRNIMLTSRGQVKMLDFGLAKIIGQPEMTGNSSMETQARTAPGILMGTVQYMSPEQALGKEIDARSDIFSLGVVLYQMAAGQLPFKGSSSTETIDQILHAQPLPISRFNQQIPAEFERIVHKSMRKKPEERYQSAKELLVDLRNLYQDIGSDERQNSFDSLPLYESSFQSITKVISNSRAETKGNSERTASSAEYVVNQVKSHRIIFLFSVFLILSLIAGIIYIAYLLSNKTKRIPFQQADTTQVTTIGKATDAAISADGKHVVYVVTENGKQSLWLKQMPTASTVQIVPFAEISYQGLAFSPDGNYIFYNVWDRKGVGEIYQIPSFGGVAQKVVHDCMPGVSVSPDGKRLAFVRGIARETSQLLITVNADGSDEKIISTQRNGKGWFISTAWSFDNESIACTVGVAGNQGTGYMELVEFSAKDGTERKISQKKWMSVGGGLSWLPDKLGLLLTAGEQIQDATQLWYVDYKSGEARQVTKNLTGFNGGLSLTADGKSLVTVQQDVAMNIWTVPSDKKDDEQKITSGKYEGFSFSWSPDGKIIYASGMTGNAEIWSMNADGSDKKQLTGNPAGDVNPTVSPDGKTIVFISNRGNGVPHLWQMNSDGSNQRQLTNGTGEWLPFFSPIEQAVYFMSHSNDKQTLKKISLEGKGNGETVQITKTYTYEPTISQDGKLLAYSYWDEFANKFGREIISLETGQKIKDIELPLSAIGNSGQVMMRWTGDGRALTYVDNRNGSQNIWVQPLDGSPARQITNFKDDIIFYFDWSKGGKFLAVARGVATSDVVAITDIK